MGYHGMEEQIIFAHLARTFMSVGAVLRLRNQILGLSGNPGLDIIDQLTGKRLHRFI